jgi:hypothetical protein
MPIYDLRSISQVGTTEPFEVQVSRGQIPGHTTLFKYGYNSLITNVNETIWDAGGTYSYPSSAVKMTATSTDSSNDEGVQVTIQGLDANYEELSETVTLGEAGTQETSGFFLRVFRAFIEGPQEPSGTINITNASTTYARITLGENQTLMAVYTVPVGKSLYLHNGTTSHGTDTSGAFMTVRFMIRAPGGVFRTAVKVDVTGGELLFPFKYPLRLPEKYDLEVRAICNKNQNNAVSATFEGVLVNEQGPL